MLYWVHLNVNNFAFKKEESESQPSTNGTRVVEVTRQIFNKIGNGIGWRFQDGEWIAPPMPVEPDLEDQVTARVVELKNKLRETDHLVVEILEYQLVNKEAPHDIEKVYNERQAWRDEINQLLGGSTTETLQATKEFLENTSSI